MLGHISRLSSPELASPEVTKLINRLLAISGLSVCPLSLPRMNWKIVFRLSVIAAVSLLMSQVSCAASERVPAWLIDEQTTLRLSALKMRFGTFQGITSVGAGDDLALGFTSFYLRNSQITPVPVELSNVLRTFLQQGDKLPERFPLSGACAAFLLFSDGKHSEPLLVVISQTRPFVSIGKAHVVDEDVYQSDAKSVISASGESEQLWTFFESLAKKLGTLAKTPSK
jgi:hypothetical protein